MNLYTHLLIMVVLQIHEDQPKVPPVAVLVKIHDPHVGNVTGPKNAFHVSVQISTQF